MSRGEMLRRLMNRAIAPVRQALLERLEDRRLLAGNGLQAEYYSGATFTTLQATRTDATVAFNWGTGAPGIAGIGSDNFSVRWSGQVQPPTSGNWTFYTTADDGVRLWVNGQLVADGWRDQATAEYSGTISLVGGQKYDIRMEYYEAGGDAIAELRWSGPGTGKQIIPNSALFAPATTTPDPSTGTGLRAQYFSDRNFITQQLERIDPTIDFDWEYGSPSAGINNDSFAARWTGQVQPPTTGTWTFYTLSDDGIRVWVDDQLLIDQWNDQAITEHSGSISLQGGQKYNIRVEYYESGGNAVAKLSWAGPGTARQPISTSRLFAAGESLPIVGVFENDSIGSEANDPVSFIVRRGGDLTQPLTVTFTYSGTATAADFDGLPTTLTFAPGQNTFTVTLRPVDDLLQEGTETLIVRVAESDAYRAAGGVELTIHDNDIPVEETGTGLRGQYFSDRAMTNRVFERVDPTVNFNWDYGSPGTGLGVDNFAVRWQGKVQPTATGQWTFFTDSDDGIRLFVNDELVIDQWNDHALAEHSATVTLIAGQKYNIRVDYYEAGGNAVARLSWAGPGVGKQIIPASQLYADITTQPPSKPVVAISTSDASGSEHGDPFSFTVTRAGQFGGPVTVLLNYTGTVSSADIVGGLPASVLIPAGQSSVTVTLQPVDDALVEGTEVLNVAIAEQSAYTVTPGSVALTLTDNDTATPPTGGTGLKAEYFRDRAMTQRAIERLDAQVAFNWGLGGPGAPLGNDNFTVRWTGQVQPAASGNWTFYTTADDGVRLWVNGQLLVDGWRDQAAAEYSGTINLVAGQKYDIRMEYYEEGGDAIAELRWAGPGTGKQLIPTANLYPPATSTPVTGWWNTQWNYRVAVNVNVGEHARADKTFVTNINFSSAFASAGTSGALILNSLRVVEVSADGSTVLNSNVPFQFDQAAGYNASTNASGQLVILASGSTAADATRYFHVYFDKAGTFSAPTVTPRVVTTDNVNDEGQSSVRIVTTTGTYYYQKENGGLSSFVDTDGNDWINFHPGAGSGSAGEFRGIPNAVFPGGGFHPGFVNATTTIVSTGPLRTVLKTDAIINRNGSNENWSMTWEFFSTHATVTVTQAPGYYWFLYEGTPGGSIDANDYVVRSNNVTTPLSQSWTEANGLGDGDDEWLYFVDGNSGRYLFLVNHEADDIVDSYYLMENNMTVFGFGRNGGNSYMTAANSRFTLGLGTNPAFGAASDNINAAYRDVLAGLGAVQVKLVG